MADEQDEISVSGELTETGIKAAIKSRAVSAWDRFFGSKADKQRAPIEAEIAETNAISAARVKMIEALGELGVDRLKSDPEFAARAVETFIPSLLRRQENKDAVLELALEDLRQNPGTEQEASEGPPQLDDGFLNRFERYAEDATDEQIRERWAKVLASEIRKPGTFSGKVLRVVDELDASTAALFERVCQYRITNVIPKSLLGEISYIEAARLSNADLIFEPGLGQIRASTELTDNGGVKLWMWGFGSVGVAAIQTGAIPNVDSVMKNIDGKAALPVFVLTDMGLAISSILVNDIGPLINQLAAKISEVMPTSEVRKYVRIEQTSQWRQVGVIPPKQPQGAGQS